MAIKQKRLAQINKRMMKNMKKKENEQRNTKNMLERSGNISNMADYIIGETMGNQMLETQQNLRIMQSSDQNSSQMDLSSFNSDGSIKTNKIDHNDIMLETKRDIQVEKPNFGNL
jgi:hypothetical protein